MIATVSGQSMSLLSLFTDKYFKKIIKKLTFYQTIANGFETTLEKICSLFNSPHRSLTCVLKLDRPVQLKQTKRLPKGLSLRTDPAYSCVIFRSVT